MINKAREWAINWLSAMIDSGNFSDTYFHEFAQLFAFDNNNKYRVGHDELDSCNKALKMTNFF